MDTANGPGEVKVLTFQVGGARYGVLLEWVLAVQGTAVIEAEDGEEDVVFRGEKLPFVDLSSWFRDEGRQVEGTSLLVLGRERALAAAGVDSPGHVITVAEVRQWPTPCRPLVEGVFAGVVQEGEEALLLVDPEGLCRAAAAGVKSAAKEA